MQKKRGTLARILALVLAGLMVLSALMSILLNMAYAEGDKPSTAISAEVAGNLRQIRCEQTLHCPNPADEELSQLFFTLYPNAFRRFDSLPVDVTDFSAVFPDAYLPGGIELHSVLVNGEPARWGVVGEDEVFLRVDVALAPGETAEIALSYTITLAPGNAFVGYTENEMRLTHAWITPCPMQNGGFRTNGVLSVGSFAYAEPMDWTLTLTLPKGTSLVLGGGLHAEEVETLSDGRACVRTGMENARDLPVLVQKKVPSLGKAADMAAQMEDTLEGWFGKAPWGQTQLARSSCAPGVLSSAGLVLLPESLFARKNAAELRYELATALARQVFSERVEVDPYAEPWLSESLGGVFGLLLLEELYGADAREEAHERFVAPALSVTVPGGVAADSKASYFNSRSEYELMLRGRGTAAVWELREVMGAETFLAAVQGYVAACTGGEGTLDAFIEACDSVSAEHYGRFLLDMLANIGS